jgi:3-oxoacyl-[acyl-carrier protein] reductase
VSDFRHTVDVNLVGTLIPIAVMGDRLRVARGSIVTFSGGGATTPLRRFDAYAASKAAVVRLTENLAADLSESGVRINAVAPGFVASDIHRGTLAVGPELAGREYFERTAATITAGSGDPPAEAAKLSAFLLSDAAVNITGRLISAQWDPWRDPAFQLELQSDAHLATLRRIDDQFFTSVQQ